MADWTPTNLDPVGDPAQAQRSTLEALAKALDEEWSKATMTGAERVKAALVAYRRETRVPLRTRAQVDAELVEQVRAYARESALQSDECAVTLRGLLSEPTAPTPAPCSCEVIRKWNCPVHGSAQTHGPSSDDHGQSPPARAAAGATFSDLPDPDERECNCNQALALKESFARFVYYNLGGWLTNDVDRERWREMRWLPDDVRARVESYHEQRATTGSIPDWCRR